MPILIKEDGTRESIPEVEGSLRDRFIKRCKGMGVNFKPYPGTSILASHPKIFTFERPERVSQLAE